MKTESTIYIVLFIVMVFASSFRERPAKYVINETFTPSWEVVDTIVIIDKDTIYEKPI